MSAARTYADKQRKGLQEAHVDSLSMLDHVGAALSAPFFLSLNTPLPESVSAALAFVASSPPELGSAFWEEQLLHTEVLIADALPTDLKRNKIIPAEIPPASGKLKLAPLMSLLYQHDLGGSIWLQQFIFGFKLTGSFSQKHTFPQSDKLVGLRPLCLASIAQSNRSLFREMAQKSGYKNARPLWGESLAQSAQGWLTKPSPLSSSNEPFILRGPKLYIAFRFGVEQSDKLRACDDLRYSMVNLACKVETPIKLASWGHVAEMRRSVQSIERFWHFMKSDHEAAYKQLPLEWCQSSLAVVALRSPEDGRWYGFFSRTLLFGAAAAVVHYNVFSRIISELVCRIFGIPMISYFDDFGAMLPEQLAQKEIATFAKWRILLGIGLKLKNRK